MISDLFKRVNLHSNSHEGAVFNAHGFNIYHLPSMNGDSAFRNPHAIIRNMLDLVVLERGVVVVIMTMSPKMCS